MTTLEDIVVGRQPPTIMPTRRPGSMKERFVAHALTMPKIMAEVIKKLCIWTKRWIFHFE
jgi:hypothetical protein